MKDRSKREERSCRLARHGGRVTVTVTSGIQLRNVVSTSVSTLVNEVRNLNSNSQVPFWKACAFLSALHENSNHLLRFEQKLNSLAAASLIVELSCTH